MICSILTFDIDWLGGGLTDAYIYIYLDLFDGCPEPKPGFQMVSGVDGANDPKRWLIWTPSFTRHLGVAASAIYSQSTVCVWNLLTC